MSTDKNRMKWRREEKGRERKGKWKKKKKKNSCKSWEFHVSGKKRKEKKIFEMKTGNPIARINPFINSFDIIVYFFIR